MQKQRTADYERRVRQYILLDTVSLDFRIPDPSSRSRLRPPRPPTFVLPPLPQVYPYTATSDLPTIPNEFDFDSDIAPALEQSVIDTENTIINQQILAAIAAKSLRQYITNADYYSSIDPLNAFRPKPLDPLEQEGRERDDLDYTKEPSLLYNR